MYILLKANYRTHYATIWEKATDNTPNITIAKDPRSNDDTEEDALESVVVDVRQLISTRALQRVGGFVSAVSTGGSVSTWFTTLHY